MIRRDAQGAERLRRVRGEAGLTQERLAAMSGLNVRTIRGLEAGSISRPHRHSLESIIFALGMPVADRESFIESWGISSEWGIFSEEAFLGGGSIHHQQADAAHPVEHQSVLVATKDTIQVAADRTIRWSRTEEGIISTADALRSRRTFFEADDPSIDLHQLRLVNLENCRLQDRSVHEGTFLSFELSFDPPIPRGGSHFYSYTTDYSQARRFSTQATPYEVNQCIVGTFRPPMSLIVRVQFDSRSIPRRCWRVRKTRPCGRMRRLQELSIDAWNVAHLVLANPAAGGHGISWEW